MLKFNSITRVPYDVIGVPLAALKLPVDLCFKSYFLGGIQDTQAPESLKYN